MLVLLKKGRKALAMKETRMCPDACDAGRRRGNGMGPEGRQAWVLILVMLAVGC